jgi:hypothetical protein
MSEISMSEEQPVAGTAELLDPEETHWQNVIGDV